MTSCNFYHKQHSTTKRNTSLTLKRQKNKYIYDILMKEYPDEKEKYSDKEKMKKERVATKIKSIRSGF